MRPPSAHARRLGGERGQALPLLALVLIVMLGTAAIVVDLGRAYVVQRALQSSVDAAALAGAQELPDSGVAIATAEAYGGEAGARNERTHFPPVSTTATTECRAGKPCSPVNAVVVKETASVPAGFAKLFGLDSFDVSARAVAAIQPGTVPWAIFAYDQDCGSLVFRYNGNVFDVEGGIHSNGNFEVNGMNITSGYASSGGPNDCEPTLDGEHIDFDGRTEPVRDTSLLDWPAYFETSEFPCTYTAEEFKFNTTGVAIPPGVYCASKLFEVNADNATGQITVLAPEIKAGGNDQHLTPYLKDVLFFATGSKEMVLNGNGYTWAGIIFHPGGRVKINGDDDSFLNGMIEARQVEVNGNTFGMAGNGPATAGTMIALVE